MILLICGILKEKKMSNSIETEWRKTGCQGWVCGGGNREKLVTVYKLTCEMNRGLRSESKTELIAPCCIIEKKTQNALDLGGPPGQQTSSS